MPDIMSSIILGILALSKERSAEPSSRPALLTPTFSRRDLLERACAGGYPEVRRLAARERPGWFRDYVLTTIERDVVQLSGIRKVAEMGQLLRLRNKFTAGIALYTGNEVLPFGDRLLAVPLSSLWEL